MATYWVAADGNDANDGLSYANRKLTWKNALDTAKAAGAGNTVNVVAPSGSPLVIADGGGATLSSLAGTDYDSAPGMRIQGTNSSGTAAHAYIHFQDSATGITALSLSTGANKIDIRGLFVDWSGNSTAAGSKNFCRVISAAANGVRMTDCVGKWGLNVRGQLLDTASTISSDDCVFRYNVFIATDGVAAGNPSPMPFDPRGQLTCKNNIWIIGGVIAGNVFPVHLGGNDANLTNHNVSNNTFYFVSGMTIPGELCAIISTDASPFSGTPIKTVKDNLLYWEATTAGRQWMRGNASASPSAWSINIGYNQLHLGASGSWQALHPYMNPWDATGTDADDPDAGWTGDNEVVADPFFDLGSTYVWGMSGIGYSVELPYDLRVNNPYRETSSTGGVPGAIVDSIAAGPDLTIDKAAIGTWQVGEIGEFSLTVRNGGDTTATATIEVTDTLPAGITYRGASGIGWSVSVASGVITATWAADLAASASTDPLIIAVNVAQAAFPSVTNTAHVESADDPTGSDDTEIITVLAADPEFPPGNPSVLLSEQAPGFPVITAGLRLHRNLELAWNLVTDGEASNIARLWSANVVLPAGATDVEMPMLLSPTSIMLETDQDITVTINETTHTVLAGGCILLTETSEIETFAVTNNSAFKVAHLQYSGTGDVTQPSSTVQDPGGGRGDDEELN